MKTFFRMWIFLAVGVLLTGCAGPTIVAQSNLDFQKIRRVALVNFEDYPGMPGSGELTSSLFETALMRTGIKLVERRQAEKILKERAFNLSGAVDAETVSKIGSLLGVDALILGNITLFTP